MRILTETDNALTLQYTALMGTEQVEVSFTEDGIAAIEFAIIAPIMIMMYFGLAEMATAISMDRRISHGTNVAGDLATQSPSLATVDLEEILSASLRVMSVQDASKVYVDMEGFIRDSSGDAVSTGRVQLNNSQANLPSYLPEADALDNSILSETSGIVVTSKARGT